MVDDFFFGFAAHAHTRNELETVEEKERELRRKNSPQEAQRLTELILNKIERDMKENGCGLEDAKLLLLYSSYRGEPEEKDRSICESILRTIEEKFKGHTAPCGLRLIGHTTAGELENEDLVLNQVSGIGYNGMSLMVLTSNLPFGVGRTWGLRTEEEALEQGREMARDAWSDFCQQTGIREQMHKSRTLHVLAQGMTGEGPGYEHFLSEGIASFMGGAREARIMSVIGGNTGDGLLALLFHQFFGKVGEQAQLRILDKEAVCALIPNLSEPSIGLDISAHKRIGRPYTFHFDPEKEPRYMYVKRIDNEDPCEAYAKAIYENEARTAAEKGLPLTITEKGLLEALRQPMAFIPSHPTITYYAFSFDFGNYSLIGPICTEGQNLKLQRPIRSYTPEVAGYLVMSDHSKVPKGARNMLNMLRTDRGFSKGDATVIVSCLSRRQSELLAGCKSGTEAEILKEGTSSTQLIGFLAYGEIYFTQLLQEPYVWNGSCWGLTFHSTSREKKQLKPEGELGIKGWIKGER
ncbi:MAG: hypothetical protein ABSD73_07510 [Candidatus Bathyarchaeia archaeon]|jgi:hypothetical protein